MTLSVIIISYNTKDLTLKCLDSIFSLSLSTVHCSLEVIVVDNASQDGSVTMIEKKFPQVHLIVNHQNFGFAKANNQALKIAQGDYLLLLNSDAQIQTEAICELISYLNSHPRVAAVTPKVVLPDGKIDPACHRGLPTPWNALTYFSKLEKLFPHSRLFSGYHQSHLDLSTAHPVEATSATALLVRKTALDEIGLFDERFFFYAEDLDWCKRCHDAGWEIHYDPAAIAVHHKSASGKGKRLDPITQKQTTEHFYETMKQYYDKHYFSKYPRWLRQLIFLGIDLKKRT